MRTRQDRCQHAHTCTCTWSCGNYPQGIPVGVAVRLKTDSLLQSLQGSTHATTYHCQLLQCTHIMSGTYTESRVKVALPLCLVLAGFLGGTIVEVWTAMQSLQGHTRNMSKHEQSCNKLLESDCSQHRVHKVPRDRLHWGIIVDVQTLSMNMYVVCILCSNKPEEVGHMSITIAFQCVIVPRRLYSRCVQTLLGMSILQRFASLSFYRGASQGRTGFFCLNPRHKLTEWARSKTARGTPSN